MNAQQSLNVAHTDQMTFKNQVPRVEIHWLNLLDYIDQIYNDT